LRILKATIWQTFTVGGHQVAGISIRLRILKDTYNSRSRIFIFCCRDIDPVEDTERLRRVGLSCVLLFCCRDIDPVEDTERSK